MRLFYQTNAQDAKLILSEGFQNSEIVEGDGCAGEKFVGELLLDNPIGWNPNPNGSTLLLAVDIPANVITGYE